MLETQNKTQKDAQNELAKFFKLVVETGESLTMFSEYIDEAWHELLEIPHEYEQFCIESCGTIIQHIPSSVEGASGEGDIAWVGTYESLYGRLDSAWFKDINGNLNEDAYSGYLNTGNVYASWKCVPASSCNGSSYQFGNPITNFR